MLQLNKKAHLKVIHFKLTPYHYLNLFGEDNLNKYKNVKKGDAISVSDDNHNYNIKIKDNGKHLQIMMLNKP